MKKTARRKPEWRLRGAQFNAKYRNFKTTGLERVEKMIHAGSWCRGEGQSRLVSGQLLPLAITLKVFYVTSLQLAKLLGHIETQVLSSPSCSLLSYNNRLIFQ